MCLADVGGQRVCALTIKLGERRDGGAALAVLRVRLLRTQPQSKASQHVGGSTSALAKQSDYLGCLHLAYCAGCLGFHKPC